MLDRRTSDEKRDRAVGAVLWASLATALAPIVLALALQPVIGRQTFANAMDVMQTELKAGQSAAGEQLRAITRGAFPGLARLVQSVRAKREPEPPPGSFADAPLREVALDVGGARFADPRTCPESARADGEAERCDPPIITLRSSMGATLRLIAPGNAPPALAERATAGPADWPADLDPLSGAPAREPMEQPVLGAAEWRARDAGVYVAERGQASFTLSGALALDAPLRPFPAIGVGGYPAGLPELHRGALSGRAERIFAHGQWRVRPEIDLSASYLALDEVRLDLFLPDTEDWVLSARPSVALEGEIVAPSGLIVSPSLRAGAMWLSQSELFAAASMLDAPARIGGFHAIGPIDELFADVEAGLNLTTTERFRLSLSYGGMFGDAFESHAGQLELNMQF